MKMRVLSLVAAVAFLAACSSDADQKGAQTGGGASAGAGSTSSVPGPVAGSPGDFVKNVGDRVFFDYDKYDVRADQRAALDRQADWLKKYPATKITVEGHCDERGTREYNLALGERRANAVKEYLVAKGVATARVKTISYGKERPVALGTNETAWAQNRRGVTVVE